MKGLDDEVVSLPSTDKSEVLGKASTEFILPREYMSVSQINMYLRCPRQYEFRYIKGDTNPPGIAMVMGSALHHAVEKTHQQTIDTGRPLPQEATVAEFSDKWDAMHTDMELVADPDDRDADINTKDMGVKLVKNYYQNTLPTIRPIEVEKKVEYLVEGVPMLGYIDLIDTAPEVPDGVPPCTCENAAEKSACQRSLLCNMQSNATVVADTKVVKRKKSQKDIDNDLQLTGYALATGTNRVRFDCLVKSNRNPTVVQIGATRTKDDFRWYGEVVKGVADGITKGSFPTCPPDSWCCSPKWCGYWSKCRGKKS